ncbi:MAG: WD40 repeat domain-containing protein [Phycisphaeraceae bacterium]|nr:WD40 repeat domain-containing protein [Phycisphaerales bacterium]MCB9859715.1 WD40 repeat domain-containing protein [Phycisphaeraceae bacterium]
MNRNNIHRHISTLAVLGIACGAIAQSQCVQPEWMPIGMEHLPLTDFGQVGMINKTLAWDPDGSGPAQHALVTGGQFVSIAGVDAINIAMFDFKTRKWHPIGNELGRPVGSLAYKVEDLAVTSSGELYACGRFPPNSLSPNGFGVAKWDGNAWVAPGEPPQTTFHSIDPMSNGGILASAGFNVYTWSAGSPWSLFGTANGLITEVVELPNGDVVIAGQFTSVDGVPVVKTARWDGTIWHEMAMGLNDQVDELIALPNGHAVACGSIGTGVQIWDGQSWTPLGGGVIGTVDSIGRAPNGDIVAAGDFLTGAPAFERDIARWDGTAWSSIGKPLRVSTGFSTVAMFPDGDFVVSGDWSNPPSGSPHTIARWDGSDWDVIGNGFNQSISTSTLLPDGGFVLAGAFTVGAGIAANGIIQRHGQEWSSLGEEFPSTYFVNAVTVTSNGDMIVGGRIFPAFGQIFNNIARWDGATWHPLGDGIGSIVDALVALSNDDVVAGGRFLTASGITVNHIARWDGSDWHALGDGIDGAVWALAQAANGDVIAGGGFQMAGGVPTSNIARWDGTSWSPLGSGLSGTVYSLIRLPTGDVIAGGAFTLAGGLRHHILRAGMVSPGHQWAMGSMEV